MSAYQLKTFSDIYSAVLEELKVPLTDTTTVNRIKRDINLIYQTEVIPYEQWKWLRGYACLQYDARFSSGTATVTEASTTVTCTTAPAASRKGHWFSVDGQNDIYRIAQHTAGSTTFVLEAKYAGSTTSTASFKIWTDKIPLPQDCRETIQITHDYMNESVEALGLQKYRQFVVASPKAEGRPKWYTTADYRDPAPFATISGLPALSTRASSGLLKTLTFASSIESYLEAGERFEIQGSSESAYNGTFVAASVSAAVLTYTSVTNLTESAIADASLSIKLLTNQGADEAYRELWVYPSIYASRVQLHVDYIKEVASLEDDDDEPLMPIGDRVVLLYGALMRAWSRHRNPEEAQRNAALYERKLQKMAGKIDDSVDYPVLRPNKTYLAAKRNSQRTKTTRFLPLGESSSGSSGGSTIFGTALTLAAFSSAGELTSLSQVTYTTSAITSSLAIRISDTTTSTSSITGCATFAGGVGIAGDTYIGGDLYFGSGGNVVENGTAATVGFIRQANNNDGVMWRNASDTANIGIWIDASNNLRSNAGALVLDGTMGITSGGVMTFTNTTDATSITAGGNTTISGGLAVAKKAFVGSGLAVGGALNISGSSGIYVSVMSAAIAGGSSGNLDLGSTTARTTVTSTVAAIYFWNSSTNNAASIQVENAVDTVATSGAMYFRTLNAGVAAIGLSISSLQLVTIGKSTGTQTHVVNGSLSITNASASQLTLTGFSSTGGASASNGQLLLGTGNNGRIQYSLADKAIFIDNTLDDAAGVISFRLRNAGTPVTPLTMTGAGLVTIGASGGSQAHVVNGSVFLTSSATFGGNTTGDSNFGTISSVSLSTYYTGSVSTTFIGPFTSSQVKTVNYTRVGRMVTLHIPATSGAASANQRITNTGTELPSGIRPIAEISFCIPSVFDNTGADVAATLRIDSAGLITVGKDTAVTAFTASGTCGWDRAVSVSYYV